MRVTKIKNDPYPIKKADPDHKKDLTPGRTLLAASKMNNQVLVISPNESIVIGETLLYSNISACYHRYKIIRIFFQYFDNIQTTFGQYFNNIWKIIGQYLYNILDNI